MATPSLIRSQHDMLSCVHPSWHLSILMSGEISGLIGGTLSFFSDIDGQGVVVEQ
jgi:hypothetical protein